MCQNAALWCATASIVREAVWWPRSITVLRDAIGMQSGWAYDAEPPRPTQARNSGRAEHCWIAGRGWMPRRGD